MSIQFTFVIEFLETLEAFELFFHGMNCIHVPLPTTLPGEGLRTHRGSAREANLVSVQRIRVFLKMLFGCRWFSAQIANECFPFAVFTRQVRFQMVIIVELNWTLCAFERDFLGVDGICVDGETTLSGELF